MKLQVGWANRHWLQCVAEVLATLFDTEAMQRLGFTTAQLGEDHVAQAEDARLFTKLVIRTASARSWSMASWSEIPPENLCDIAAQDMTEANEAFARARGDAEAVQAAMAATCAAPRHPEHEALCSGFSHPASRIAVEWWLMRGPGEHAWGALVQARCQSSVHVKLH